MRSSDQRLREPWITVAPAVTLTAAGSAAFWMAAARPYLGAAPAAGLAFATVAGVCWTQLAPCGPGVPPPLPGCPPAGDWIALTFDDGPEPGSTDRVLDALVAAGAHATFFALGSQARAHPDLIRRMAAEGHTVGLHGDRHRTVVFASPARLRAELEGARAAVVAAAPGAAPRFYRPPCGLRRPGLVREVRRRGFALALWNLDSRDYNPGRPEAVAERVLSLAAPGKIVLMHDGGPGAARTPDALPALLAGLAAKGLRCVSLDELVAVEREAGV